MQQTIGANNFRAKQNAKDRRGAPVAEILCAKTYRVRKLSSRETKQKNFAREDESPAQTIFRKRFANTDRPHAPQTHEWQAPKSCRRSSVNGQCRNHAADALREETLSAKSWRDETQTRPRAGKAKGFGKPKPFIFSNRNYLTIFETTPEPTVLPPSRIAKRRPSSTATGLMSETSILTLSPGMTISTPSGSLMEPVTSVVRMKN